MTEKKRKAPEHQEQEVAEPPAAPPTAAAQGEGDEAAEGKKVRKKARWSEEKKEAARKERGLEPKAKAAGAGDDGEALPPPAEKKDKKKKKEEVTVRKLAPEERVSGPSNADEALKIRATLGFVGEPDTAPQTTGGQFAFTFNGANAAPPAATNGATKDDGSSSDSDSEADEAPAAADQPSKSSSDSDSSSSGETSSSSSSSDSEDDNAQETKQGPAGQQTAAPASSALDSEYVPRRVYVGGMPYSYSENDVREYWEYCGAIESLDLLTFPDTGRFRGIAFVTFATEEGYAAALECNGVECDGQTLKVQKCKWSAKDRQQAARQAAAGGGAAAAAPTPRSAAVPPPQQYQSVEGDGAAAAVPPSTQVMPKAPAPKTAGYDVAYVGNVAFEADEAALRALFEPCGVTKVRLHTDKDTGRSKGYAHVHFK